MRTTLIGLSNHPPGNAYQANQYQLQAGQPDLAEVDFPKDHWIQIAVDLYHHEEGSASCLQVEPKAARTLSLAAIRNVRGHCGSAQQAESIGDLLG